jgi:hypothetical protein
MVDTDRQLAEQVRAACVQAALDAYEDAGVLGLCAEGRWEYTIGVIRQMDLEPLLVKAASVFGESRDKPLA